MGDPTSPEDEQACIVSATKRIERWGDGANAPERIRRVQARLLRVYGSYLSATRDAADPRNVPVFDSQRRAAEFERVRGSRLDRAIFVMSPETYAADIVRRKWTYRWQGSNECIPSALGYQSPPTTSRYSAVVVPTTATDATMFHELCHLFTCPTYERWSSRVPDKNLARAFEEAHVEALTLHEIPETHSTIAYDADARRLMEWVPKDALAYALFGGHYGAMEAAMTEKSRTTDLASAVAAWARDVR